MKKNKLRFTFWSSVVTIATLSFLSACGDNSTTSVGAFDSLLTFDKTKYKTINVTLDGKSTPVRWYREVCFLNKPMKLAPIQAAGAVDNQDCGYQKMNIFIREEDAAKQDNAILFNVSNSG
jgi:hypothetical protein